MAKRILSLPLIAAAALFLVGTSASHSQNAWSRGDVAAKNIFLAIRGSFLCDRLTFVSVRINEYAQQNEVDVEGLKKNQGGKYKAQWQYATEIVNAHIKLAGPESLCKNIVRDFGPTGTLVAGLVAETDRSTHELGDEFVNRIIREGVSGSSTSR
jgi:hypothetical protein